MKILIKNLSETKLLAKKLKTKIKRGDILAFFGDMGVGKTTFIKELCKELSYSGNVSSPTFSIINEYILKDFKIIHCDMYKIKTIYDLENLCFFDYLNDENIIMIEWAENIIDFFNYDYIKIKIKTISDNEREFSLKGINIT